MVNGVANATEALRHGARRMLAGNNTASTWLEEGDQVWGTRADITLESAPQDEDMINSARGQQACQDPRR